MGQENSVSVGVFITPEAKARLDLYLQTAGKNEITGHGLVIKQRNNFIITQLFLLKQTVSVGSCSIDESDQAKFLMELANKGINPANVCLWWHSHGNGGVFWSGTDDIEVNKWDGPYKVSIVGNSHGQYRTRVDIFEPIRATFDNLPLEVITVCSDSLAEEVAAEIKEKVTIEELKPAVQKYLGMRQGYYYPGYGADSPTDFGDVQAKRKGKKGKNSIRKLDNMSFNLISRAAEYMQKHGLTLQDLREEAQAEGISLRQYVHLLPEIGVRTYQEKGEGEPTLQP